MLITKNQAIEQLKNNKIICIPTDTVFGIAALATKTNSFAIAKLKGNVEDKLYSVMVASKKEALSFWKPNPVLTQLIDKHFPSDLTIIAQRRKDKGFIGIRIPDSPLLLSIIKETGPIFATSTNKSGEEPLNSYEDIKTVFPQLLILEGECGNKKPSTIIKIIDSSIEIIRQGDKVI